MFENLLATYNPETQTTARKLTGSFYTPREIVDYMVDQSLQAYLAQALPVPAGSAAAGRLALLFQPEDPAAADPNPFGAGSADTRALIGALSRCRVLDPACGSGAFPMGVLHRMVALLRRLDPDNRYFQEEQLRLADEVIAKAEEIMEADVREPAVHNAQQRRAAVLASFEKDAAAARAEAARRPGPLADGLRRQNYARKLFLIENCIYGVDIQQIAVQIAKLRFFISLLAEQRVDEAEENRNILAMPNLETKFVAANTLVPLDRANTLVSQHPLVQQREAELQQVRQQLFFVRRYAEKKRLRQREKAKRTELSQALETAGFSRAAANQVAEWSPLDVMHPAGFFDAETMFGVADGFDVVIGNPPYGAKLDKSYKQFYPNTSFGGIESYKFFIEKGLTLTKNQGTLAYITSDSYLEKESFLDLRKFLVKNASRIENVKLGLGIFENVGLPTSLLFANHEISRVSRLFLADLTDEHIASLSKQVPASLKELSAQAATLMLFVEKQDLLDKTGTSPLINHYDQVMGVKVYQIGKGIPKQTSYEFQNDLFVSKTIKGETWMPFVDSGIKRYYRDAEVKYINYGKWLAEPRELKYFLQPKILIREVVNPRVFAAYVEEPIVAKNTLAVIVQKSEKFDLKYLLSIVNFSVFNYYIIENSPKGTTKLFPSLNSNLIKRFPLKTISKLAQLPFIRLVEYVLWLKAQHPADSRAQYFERVIDGLVYELYFPAALKAGGCEVSPHLPPLPALPTAADAAETQLQGLYAQLEDRNHPVRKALFFMDTVEEVAIVEGKRK